MALLRKHRDLLELRRQVRDLRDEEAAVAEAAVLPITVVQPMVADAPAMRPANDNSRSKVSIRDVRLILQPFTGSPMSTYDVYKFLSDFEQFFSTVEHNPTYKFLALRSLMTEAAAEFMMGSQAMSYEAMKTELIAEFGQAISTTELIDQLRACRWNSETEDMHRYVLRMQGLARRGTIPEREFIDIVIGTMCLQPYDQAVLVSSSTNMATFKDAIRRHEKKFRASANLQRCPAALGYRPATSTPRPAVSAQPPRAGQPIAAKPAAFTQAAANPRSTADALLLQLPPTKAHADELPTPETPGWRLLQMLADGPHAS